jgi:hypothetical protein
MPAVLPALAADVAPVLLLLLLLLLVLELARGVCCGEHSLTTGNLRRSNAPSHHLTILHTLWRHASLLSHRPLSMPFGNTTSNFQASSNQLQQGQMVVSLSFFQSTQIVLSGCCHKPLNLIYISPEGGGGTVNIFSR